MFFDDVIDCAVEDERIVDCPVRDCIVFPAPDPRMGCVLDAVVYFVAVSCIVPLSDVVISAKSEIFSDPDPISLSTANRLRCIPSDPVVVSPNEARSIAESASVDVPLSAIVLTTAPNGVSLPVPVSTSVARPCAIKLSTALPLSSRVAR